MPIELTGGFLFFLGLLLLFVIGTFLYVRKVLVSFREGVEKGRQR